MAPVHESDLEENRFKSTEWSHYELWEKVEIRLRRKKWLWVGLVFALFIALSAVPVFDERREKWTEVAGLRKLSEELDAMKLKAGSEKVPMQLRFSGAGLTEFLIERVENCETRKAAVQEPLVSTGSLFSAEQAQKFRVLSAEDATKLSIPGVADSICYDPIQGIRFPADSKDVQAIALIPKTDLEESRSDRVAILLVSGPDGEMSFE